MTDSIELGFTNSDDGLNQLIDDLETDPYLRPAVTDDEQVTEGGQQAP